VLNKEKALPVRLLEGLFHDPFGGCLTKKKPCRAALYYGLYYFHPFRKQAFFDLKIIKP
jgi:hypothetical protein